MCGQPRGALYERYHLTPYDPARMAARAREIFFSIAEVQFTLSKVTSNPPDRPIWFVDICRALTKYCSKHRNPGK